MNEDLKILKSKPTIEGAGVRLKRAFGYYEVPLLDPFLLLDDFHSDNPDDYLAGFPWHPHRGIETVTYMLHGRVKHGDSLKNNGVIKGGDVQWMTAGSGIIHSEMPEKEGNGLLWGFQLWVNLPAVDKMMPPRYQEVTSDTIPEAVLENEVRAKVICGKAGDVEGPVRDIVVDAEYLDVTVPPDTEFRRPVKNSYTCFAYGIEGAGEAGNETKILDPEHLVIFSGADEAKVVTQSESVRFLLISGKPIGEPVAWRGPIVMNTDGELETAFREYQSGTFIKGN
ncbi:pirin family protein [Fibrobacterota bacterium]